MKILSYAFRAVVCIVLLSIAVGTFNYLKRTAPVPETAAGATAPRVVPVMRMEPVSIGRPWQGYGTARPLDSADIPSRVNAVVATVAEGIEEGVAVAAGDELAVLDDTDFKRSEAIAAQRILEIDEQLEQVDLDVDSWTTRVELAAENLRLAEGDYQRTVDALEDGAAKQFEVDRARQSVIAASREHVAARTELDKLGPRRAALTASRGAQVEQQQQARDNIKRCTIISPIDGVITMLDVEEGEHLSNGHRVARVVGTEVIEVPLKLPASARADLSVGQRVRLESTGERHEDWEASVARLAPEDDPSTRTMTAYVEVRTNGQAAPPPPGRYLRGTVYPADRASMFIVPRSSVRAGRVRLIEDGAVRHVEIDIAFHFEGSFPQFGLSERQWVVIRNEALDGALLVTDATRDLPEGLAIDPLVVNEGGAE